MFVHILRSIHKEFFFCAWPVALYKVLDSWNFGPGQQFIRLVWISGLVCLLNKPVLGKSLNVEILIRPKALFEVWIILNEEYTSSMLNTNKNKIASEAQLPALKSDWTVEPIDFICSHANLIEFTFNTFLWELWMNIY